MTVKSFRELAKQLERRLRRRGIEGESAFYAVAAQYARNGKTPAARRIVSRAADVLRTATSDPAVYASLNSLISSDPHGELLADLYQHFIGRRFREGSGKFFTPRPVADAMVRLLPLKDNAIILDPTCGGGTFLASASRRWGDRRLQLVGNDIESSLVDLTELILLLATPSHHRRTLVQTNFFDSELPLRRWYSKVDYVLANPPFSLPLETDLPRSRLFGLGFRTSDAVFVDLCHNLLRPGGRLVCLLPHSLIVNGEYQAMRLALEEAWRLRGIITLPEGVFHLTANTTTRADILIIEKRREKRGAEVKPDRNYTVFAHAPTVGVRLNRRMRDESNALGDLVDSEKVREALGLDLPVTLKGRNGKARLGVL